MDFEGALRSRGLRVTEARLAVLSHLRGNEQHPTAEEVEAAVNQERPVLSRASVYNVLNTLVGAGLVSRIVAGDAQTRYDANLERHHHLVCRSCGAVEDVPDSMVGAPVVSSLPDGRAVDGLAIVLSGLCLSCSGRPPREGTAGRRETGREGYEDQPLTRASTGT